MQNDGVQPTREGMNPKAIVAIVIAVLVVIFAIQNAETARIDVLFWGVDIPVWVVIAVTAVLGFVVGWILGRSSGRRRAIEKLTD
jgi:uncharacterized integral membrane protein